MEINAIHEEVSKQNGVAEDSTGQNHMVGENIQNLNNPHSNPQYPVTGLSTTERDENGAIGVPNGGGKVQIHQYSNYPFSNPQHQFSGLLRAENNGDAKEDDIKKIAKEDDCKKIAKEDDCKKIAKEDDCKKNEGAKEDGCKKNEGAKENDWKENEGANAEEVGGEKYDCIRGIGRGKDNDIPPPKPTIFNGYKLVDDFIFSDRSLVGRFTWLRPSVPELCQWSNNYWVSKLRSICMFKILGVGFFKIEFFDREDCEFVLDNGPWFMGVAGLSLKRWTSEFDPQNPGQLKTPVRMTLLDLPQEFWKEDSLVKICSPVGKVLQIFHDTDEKSDGSETARVCVEVDLSQGLLPILDLQFGGMRLKLELDYEGIPFRCKMCRSAEHLEGSCPRKSTKEGRKKGNGLWSAGKGQRMSRS